VLKELLKRMYDQGQADKGVSAGRRGAVAHLRGQASVDSPVGSCLRKPIR
jgi:hypothetical protein